MINFRAKANFIWSVADLLRGDYKQADYGKVILPLTWALSVTTSPFSASEKETKKGSGRPVLRHLRYLRWRV
jgi:type I restriction enzyme M protein